MYKISQPARMQEGILQSRAVLMTVESRMGAVAEPEHRPVSRPRSSNRTCRFPASGFPTGFTADPRRVSNWLGEAAVPPNSPNTARCGNGWCRATAPCDACAGNAVRGHRRDCQRPVRRHARSVAEVRRPAAQNLFSRSRTSPRSPVAGYQKVADLRLDPLHALLRRARAQIPSGHPSCNDAARTCNPESRSSPVRASLMRVFASFRVTPIRVITCRVHFSASAA